MQMAFVLVEICCNYFIILLEAMKHVALWLYFFGFCDGKLPLSVFRAIM